MRQLKLDRLDDDFKVVAQGKKSQAATMVLEIGASEGGPDNRHEGSDQWLYVLSGKGRARVGGEQITLDPGTLLLIEAGEAHEISNDGDVPLETVNIYAPPVY